MLAEVLSHWSDHPSVELVTTDGFLHPNQVLEERGLMERKGFPESYDLRRMLDFMIALRQGDPELKVPVYSHDSYDIVPHEFLEIRRPEILILEGLNLLQTHLPGGSKAPKIFASDLIDFSIYVDAAEEHIRQWYVERFLLLKSTAFRNPRSYFHRFADAPDEEAKAFAIDVWERINLVNLVRNVATTRERAQVVMQKERTTGCRRFGCGGYREGGEKTNGRGESFGRFFWDAYGCRSGCPASTLAAQRRRVEGGAPRHLFWG